MPVELILNLKRRVSFLMCPKTFGPHCVYVVIVQAGSVDNVCAIHLGRIETHFDRGVWYLHYFL